MLHACRTNNKVRPRRTLPTFFSQRYATGSSSGTLNRHTLGVVRARPAGRRGPRRRPRGAPAGRGVCAGRDDGARPRPRPRPARARTRGVGPEDTHGRGVGCTRDSRQSLAAAAHARPGSGVRTAGSLSSTTPYFLGTWVFLNTALIKGSRSGGAGAAARRHRNKRRLRLPARARFWRVHVRSPLLHFRPMRPCTLVLRGSAGPGSVVAAGA